MKVNLIYLLFLAFVFYPLNASDIKYDLRHEEKSGIKYDLQYQRNADTTNKTVRITFATNFDDSVLVYYNNKLICNEYLKTNFSTGIVDTEAMLQVIPKKIKSKIKIYFVKEKKYIILEVNRNYKYMTIHQMDKLKEYIIFYDNTETIYY